MSRYHNFKVGDLVRLKGYFARQEIVKVKGTMLLCAYCSNPQRPKWRSAFDFEFCKPQSNEDLMKIYKTPDNQYGSPLTKDSQGRIVLELRGQAGVVAYPEDQLEEVVPYTVKIRDTHYEVPKDKLKVGDVLVEYGVVKAVDTKCRSAVELDLSQVRRVMTEAVV